MFSWPVMMLFIAFIHQVPQFELPLQEKLDDFYQWELFPKKTSINENFYTLIISVKNQNICEIDENI